MNEAGMSIDNQKQTLLTKVMLNDYDVIVSMAGVKYTPKWLSESNKYIYWKIRDPKAVGHSTTNKTRLRIKSEIEKFIKQYR